MVKSKGSEYLGLILYPKIYLIYLKFPMKMEFWVKRAFDWTPRTPLNPTLCQLRKAASRNASYEIHKQIIYILKDGANTETQKCIVCL